MLAAQRRERARIRGEKGIRAIARCRAIGLCLITSTRLWHDLAGFHFTYISRFDRPVKPSITDIVDSIDDRPESADAIEKPNVGIAPAEPAGGLGSAAAAVRQKPGWQVVHYSISRNETKLVGTAAALQQQQRDAWHQLIRPPTSPGATNPADVRGHSTSENPVRPPQPVRYGLRRELPRGVQTVAAQHSR
ncbi:hypothetical protein SAMN02982929_01914 [Saccharopolyspora kobensis]|uniref:Uncharacterized protein n=2 Tax=Saccharopolyspora kobensis TaxID=146035 RepID=A0A1H5ZP42_9PSEU|nr:hypothetical protein SAMN02982929_01914 [Saccharopolyspora kobensis]SFF22027.1 hypothetical protein SAMN05216506_12271 [Saccharopolyspora kobensis]